MRMRDGTSYLEFEPGWNIEFFISDSANRSRIESRWVAAAKRTNRMQKENPVSDMPIVPALFYKQGSDEWRVVWPLHLAAAQQHGFTSECYEQTVEGSPEAWASEVRLSLAQMVHPASRFMRESLTNRYFSNS